MQLYIYIQIVNILFAVFRYLPPKHDFLQLIWLKVSDGWKLMISGNGSRWICQTWVAQASCRVLGTGPWLARPDLSSVFFFSDHAEDPRVTLFLARAYFSDLWKDTQNFWWNDKLANSTAWSPRLETQPPSRPNASSHQALSSLQRTPVKRAIGKFTSLEFPPKKTEESEEHWLGEIAILSHMY